MADQTDISQAITESASDVGDAQISQAVSEAGGDASAAQISQDIAEVGSDASSAQISQLQFESGPDASAAIISQLTIELSYGCVLTWEAANPGTSAGDLMIAILSPTNPDATVVVLTGWTELYGTENNPLIAALPTAILYKIATNSEPATYTFQQDIGGGPVNFEGAITIVGFRSVNTTTPINTSEESFVGLAPSGEYTIPSMIPTADHCAFVAIMTQALAAGTPNEDTPPAGYVTVADNGFCLVAANLDLANVAGPTGTKSAAKTISSVGSNTYHIALNGLSIPGECEFRDWLLYTEPSYVWEPEPESALLWQTQPTTLDFPAFGHVSRVQIAHRSTSDVTMTITVDGTIATDYVIPNGSGEYVKTFITLKAIKGKSWQFKFTSVEGMRLYRKDCFLSAKAWADTGPYQMTPVFGADSRRSGAEI